MSLFTNWNELAGAERNENELREFWTNYYTTEKLAYVKILGEKKFELKGSMADLAKEFNYETVLFAGFIEGVNTSLVKPFTDEELEALEEDTVLDVVIDKEKLFYNMLDAKADWLYNLPEWEENLSVERRKEIKKEFNATKIVVNEPKIGRNDPCPCGSGKKYKKCCANK